MKKNWERLRLVYGPIVTPLLITVLVIALMQVCALSVPYAIGKITDGFVGRQGGESLKHLYVWVFIALGIKVIDHILEYYRGVLHVRGMVYKLERHIWNLTFERITKLSVGQISNYNSGFKHEVVKQGVVSLMGIFDLIIYTLLTPFFRILIGMIAITCKNIWLGLAGWITIGGYFIVATYINKRLMPTFRRLKETESKIETEQWEIIKNLKLVIVSNKSEETIDSQNSAQEAHEKEGSPVWIWYFKICQWFRDPLIIIGQYGIIGLALWFVDIGMETPGDAVMMIGWSVSCYGSITNVGSAQRNLVKMWVSVKRYFDLIEIEPAVQNNAKPVQVEIEGNITFTDVCFRYPYGVYNTLSDENDTKVNESKNQPVLDKVSFTVKAGQKLALVGHSGAGKSTVVQLLFRGYDPDSGVITIDGHDIRTIDMGLIRQSIGYVEQHVTLWDGTVRQNLLYGLKADDQIPTDEELLETARKAGIDKFFHRLGPRPLDAIIGENGVLLSGGERQRIAIARAMIKSPRILVFDEATNALDNVNEAAIQTAIQEALKGRTGIIIAHRLSTVRDADKIIVFEKGRIVGIGKHHELLDTCSHYCELVQRELAGGESLQVV